MCKNQEGLMSNVADMIVIMDKGGLGVEHGHFPGIMEVDF